MSASDTINEAVTRIGYRWHGVGQPGRATCYYHRGDKRARLQGLPIDVPVELLSETGLGSLRRDWRLPAAAVRRLGWPPALNDFIKFKNDVWEVVTADGRCWRYTLPDQSEIVVHTQLREDAR